MHCRFNLDITILHQGQESFFVSFKHLTLNFPKARLLKQANQKHFEELKIAAKYEVSCSENIQDERPNVKFLENLTLTCDLTFVQSSRSPSPGSLNALY